MSVSRLLTIVGTLIVWQATTQVQNNSTSIISTNFDPE